MPCNNCLELNCDNCCNQCAHLSPCNTTPPPSTPCPEECEIPIYTNEQCETTTTDCVISNVESDVCLDTEEGESLTDFLTKLKDYTKNILNKLVPDESISVTPIENEDDGCFDEYDIKVNISEDEGNIIEKRADGIFATANTDVTLTPEALCSAIEDAFTIAEQPQENETDPSTYGFLSTNCTFLSAPTGFAVTGSDRVSAFGAMEWFDTLTLANADAVSGETVIIYNDTTEDLVPKNGVNYQGFGLKKIGKLTVSGAIPYKGSISNLDIQGEITVDSNLIANRTTIYTSNVISRENAIIEGYSDWHGGKFLDSTKTLIIRENAYARDIYSERETSVLNSANLYDSDLVDRGVTNFANALLYISMSTNSTSGPVVVNCRATSLVNRAIYAYSGAYPGITLKGCTGVSVDNTGIYYHLGGQDVITASLFDGNVGRSVTGTGLQVVKSGVDGDGNEVNNYVMVSNNKGFSIDGYGIYSISASMESCYGFSVTNPGIFAGGSDFAYVNTLLSNCRGESVFNYGLHATRDIRVHGGTYISHKDASDGNPIFLGPLNVSRPGEHYHITGALLQSFDPAAYKIAGDGSSLPISCRMGGNTMMCPNGTTSIATIDTSNITPLPVLVDSYGNFVY